MQTLTIEQIMEKFEDQFGMDHPVRTFVSHDDYSMVKEFICYSLQSLLLEVERRMPEGFNDLENTQSDHMRIGYQAGVNDCKQALRNMRGV